MGDEAFDEKILTEKLTKLNSSQQSIESLSKWCVSHRKKAKQVVETWDKLFKNAQRDQQVSFLYLANDILQNSRRQGSEYVNEFWKVLPSALKGAYDSGHLSCRKVVSRLVDIWGERKVFGSRGQNLKNDILGKSTPSSGKIPSQDENPSPAYIVKKPSPNPIKVVKKDENALRIKLAVGCLPEKILSAFQLVHEDLFAEEGAFTKCNDAISSIQELEKDVVEASSQGNLVGSDVVDDLQKQENVLQQCINQLENSEAIRAGLVSHLKVALDDQESKLELIRHELDVARSKVEQVSNMRRCLPPSFSAPPPAITPPTIIPTFPPTPLPPPNNPTPTPPPPPPTYPSTSFTNSMTEEVNTKATAAAMAAKLASSDASAEMLTSIISSLAAEEAASISSSSKRAKLEHSNSDGSSSAYFTTPQQLMTSLPPDSTNQLQAPFLPPHLPQFTVPANSQAMSYGYDAANLQGLVGPGVPASQEQQQAQLGNGGYYRPVGVGFYGQTHQPSTPPMHRQ